MLRFLVSTWNDRGSRRLLLVAMGILIMIAATYVFSRYGETPPKSVIVLRPWSDGPTPSRPMALEFLPLPDSHLSVPNSSRFDPPSPFVEGNKAAKVEKVVPEKPTLFDLIASHFDLPIGDIRVTADVPEQWPEPGAVAAPTVSRTQLASLLLWTVDSAGTVRDALPKASALAYEGFLLILMLAISYFFILLRNDFDHYFFDPDRGKILAGLALSAMLAVRLHYSDLSNVTSVLLLTALSTSWLPMRAKVRSCLVVLAACSVAMMLQVGIVAPAPTLRDLYGVFGIFVWDMAALGTFAVATVIYLLMSRTTRIVNHVHVPTNPSKPLVQDVRIVDDRFRYSPDRHARDDL